jgi:hypothetical protein
MISMAKGLSVPVSCYQCGRRSCTRSSRNTLKDGVMRLLGWHLWRCTACGTRFYLRRKVHDPHARIDPQPKAGQR